MKIQNALVSNILDRSRRYFAHVTTVTLSWRVQNIVVIGRVYFTLECFEFSSNFEFDRSMHSGTGAWANVTSDFSIVIHIWWILVFCVAPLQDILSPQKFAHATSESRHGQIITSIIKCGWNYLCIYKPQLCALLYHTHVYQHASWRHYSDNGARDYSDNGANTWPWIHWNIKTHRKYSRLSRMVWSLNDRTKSVPREWI